MASRVTRESIEVVATPDSSARVSRESMEVLAAPMSNAMVTRVSMEVISLNPNNPFPVNRLRKKPMPLPLRLQKALPPIKWL